MSLFNRVFGNPVPSWAPLSRAEWSKFKADVLGALDSTGVSYTAKLEEGGVDLESGVQIGFMNLVRTWKRLPPGERHDEVVAFIAAGLEQRHRRDETLDWVEAKDRLRPKLYPPDYAAEILPFIAHRVLCEELNVMLMLDLERRASGVTREALESWGVTEDEAFAIAMDNLHKHEQVRVHRGGPGGRAAITVITGDSIYSSSHALDLGRFTTPACPNGVLVMVPDRYTALFCAALPDQVEASISPILRLASELFNKSDGPVSPNLFWWKEGHWKVVGNPGDGEYKLAFPDELIDLLDCRSDGTG